MPGVVVLNPGLVDGYGNYLSVTYDPGKNALRLMTSSSLEPGNNLIGKVQLRSPDGTVDLGDETNPIRTDPTGTTAQPVTDNDGYLSVDTLQLPESLIDDRLDTNIGAWLGSTDPTVGQKAMAESIPVVISSDQTVVPVNDNDGYLSIDTMQLPAELVGNRLDTNIGSWFGSENPTIGQKTMENSIPMVIASDQTVIPINDNDGYLSIDTKQLPAELVGNRLDVNVGSWFGSEEPTVGQKPMATSIPVVVSLDQSRIDVRARVTDGYDNPISVTRDEELDANRLLTSTKITYIPKPEVAKKVVNVEFKKGGLSSDNNYFIAIDISNAFNSYRHESGTYIQLTGTSGLLLKEKNSDTWESIYGCILSIDGTQATIGYIQSGELYAYDTNQYIDRYSIQTFPVELNLKVIGSDYYRITVSETETTTSVNTSSTLKDAVGNDVTPAVGDLIVRIKRTAGTGTANIHYSFWYYVE